MKAKDSLILLIVLTLTEFSLAQNLKKNTDFGFNKKTKRVYEQNEIGENTNYVFDKKGYLIKLSSNTNKSHLPEIHNDLYYITEYKYSKKNLIEIKHIYNDTMSSIDKFSYENGKLLLSQVIRDDSVVSSKSYCYEKDRLMTITENRKDKVFVDEVVYNDEIDLKQTTQLNEDNTLRDVTREYRTKKYYMIEKYSTRYSGLKFSERTVYFYDNNKNIIEEDYFAYKEDYGRTINSYYKDILQNSKYFEKGKLVFEILYDIKGNKIEEKRYDGNNDIKYQNNYNKYGDLIQVDFFEYGKLRTKKYDYEYWD